MRFKEIWTLDPEVTFLNHGSFGATPRAILERQTEIRAEIERQPAKFFVRDLVDRLADARVKAARFVGAHPHTFAFVDNATQGVNVALRSLDLAPSDELLVTNHEYNASRNALDFVARRSGARIVVVDLPLPIETDDAIVSKIVDAVTPQTRLFLIDHVTSQTGIVMPVARLVTELDALGVDTLVDGAHAPGMLPLQLDELGAAYYTGNFHKWVCAPKGAAFLVVREDLRSSTRPLAISHGANRTDDPNERFELEFEWIGTSDPSPKLLVPEVIDHLEKLVDGGWPAIYRYNHELAVKARRLLEEALGVKSISPPERIGSLASIRLPPAQYETSGPLAIDPLQDRLLEEWKIEVPIFPWPAPPERLLRISAQIYNTLDDYERLATALRSEDVIA